MKQSSSTTLKNGDSVAIVGGGPSGSFFACRLLRESRRLDRHLDVVIIEKHRPSKTFVDGCHVTGCNNCAGGISPRLNEMLHQHGFVVPDEIIQGRVDYVWVHGQWKNFRLRVPKHMRMYSVFRGSLPARRGIEASGFDAFLLRMATEESARLQYGEVQSITYAPSGKPRLSVRKPSGEKTSLETDFVAIATGINTQRGFDNPEHALITSIERLNPAFVSGKFRRSFIFELDVGEDYLKRHFNREIHFIEYGSKRLAIEHTALIPKGRFLSVAIIGKSIDKAVLPQDSERIIREFLSLPQITRILPGVDSTSLACACFPRMAVTPAKSPYGNRFAIIGDAAGARLNKDGLFSAFVTASRLAQAVLHDGTDTRTLAGGYGKTIKRLAADNRYGHIVFQVSRLAFAWPVISRVLYQSFATELKVRDERNRPVSSFLWKLASGTADYHDLLREMLAFKAIRSMLVGAGVTLRNVMVETLFGLKWVESGRYPTAVLKEKRRMVKQFLESKLDMDLNKSPDFERMYVLKIKGSKERIVAELAKFGHPQSPFLNLRFVKVRHIRGVPNEVGSVIRYRMPLPGFETRLSLTKKIDFETLLYQLDERLADQGKLVFNVARTEDGNNKLSIYAALSFKRGRHLGGRIFWRTARALFPRFLHDVLWNHALCTIKENVELSEHRTAGGPS